jgi:hypothetical protein
LFVREQTYIDVNSKLRTLLVSVGDRHCFDAHPEPDQNFYFDADPDGERHQNDADPHVDPTQRITHVGITEIRFLLTFTALPVHLGVSFSSLIPIRTRRMIGMPWMPIPIRQNDAYPTRSGSESTTQRYYSFGDFLDQMMINMT